MEQKHEYYLTDTVWVAKIHYKGMQVAKWDEIEVGYLKGHIDNINAKVGYTELKHFHISCRKDNQWFMISACDLQKAGKLTDNLVTFQKETLIHTSPKDALMNLGNMWQLGDVIDDGSDWLVTRKDKGTGNIYAIVVVSDEDKKRFNEEIAKLHEDNRIEARYID